MSYKSVVHVSSPLRMSFVGGGTDIRSFFELEGGAVVALAIEPRMHVRVISNDRNDVSIIGKYPEHCESAKQVANPIIRNCLEYFGIKTGLEINISCDLRSEGGLATSSALVCACVLAFSLLFKNESIGPEEIAKIASFIEIEMCKRPIGLQDHYASAFGGMRRYEFLKNGDVKISDLQTNTSFFEKLMNEVALYDTGISRDAGEVHKNLDLKRAQFDQPLRQALCRIKFLVNDFEKAFISNDMEGMGVALALAWAEKRKLSARVSLPVIDQTIQEAMELGGFGAKLLGAGGGGHILILAPEKIHDMISEKTGLRKLSFKLAAEGTRNEEV